MSWALYIMVLTQNAIVWHPFSTAKFDTEQECLVWAAELNKSAEITERYFCLEK